MFYSTPFFNRLGHYSRLVSLLVFFLHPSTLADDNVVLDIGPLRWSLANNHQYDSPYLNTLSSGREHEYHKNITHQFRVRDPNHINRWADIGFNEHGGGYAWSLKLWGFDDIPDGEELGQAGYGKGMLGAIRDQYHNNDYNPEQAGQNDYQGVHTEVDHFGGRFEVLQFQPALYIDGSGTQKEMNRPALANLMPLRSGFDFSSLTVNQSKFYGVPAFSHFEYWVFARRAFGIHHTTTDDTKLIHDISANMNGIQTPSTEDFSSMAYTMRGIRPDARFRYLFFRQDAEWKSVDLEEKDTYRCYFDLNPANSEIVGSDFYKDTNGDPIVELYHNNQNDDEPGATKEAICYMDVPLVILGTQPSPEAGTAIGLFVPPEAILNSEQIRVIRTDQKKELMSEDRRMALFFSVGKKVKSITHENDYRFVAMRAFLSGMLSPQSAEIYHNTSFAREVVTSKTVTLLGTPQNIYDGIKNKNK